MEFRPCIDIHNGKVKQIIGSSLKDKGDSACDNFVSSKDAGFYAELYKKDNLKGAHVIILNSKDSDYYKESKAQAMRALSLYKNALQIGGGVNDQNAKEFIDAGASHVIVTSFVFKDGKVNMDNLKKLVNAVGKEHIVLDLSAGLKDGRYFVVTDRWQKFTKEEVNVSLFEDLSLYCDEFLVHATNVEGKRAGIDKDLIGILSKVAKTTDIKITYAGGISSMDDVDHIKKASDNKLNFTVGSALDLFGGDLKYEALVKFCK